MTSGVLPRLPLPAAGWPLALLLGAFLLVGSVGHDPWKIEDATHFGVVWRALGSGDWVLLRLANSATPEPPLFYWVAGALGQALSPLLGWPDAVRLTSPLFAALALLLIDRVAVETQGRALAGAAALTLAGSLGFLVHSHETQPMLATLAAITAVYAGTALTHRRPFEASLLLGGGLAGAFLAHGATLLPALLASVVGGIALAPARRAALAVAFAGLVLGVALSAPWLSLMHTASPAGYAGWWQAEWTQTRIALDNAPRWLQLLTWFAWPALPLAAWAVWSERRRLRSHALPLLFAGAMLGNLVCLHDARPVTALASLPALALLAVPGVAALRRGAANAFDWFARMTFTLLVALIWLGWAAMNFGVPARIARNFAKLAPGFVAPFEALAVAAAVVAGVLWFWLLLAGRQSARPDPLRPLAHWTCGMALLWISAICLWLPWIEHGKTYRAVAAAIDAQVPGKTTCIATRGLGEGQAASLDYFLEHRLRARGERAAQCGWLLVQGGREEASPGAPWLKVWEGARPGDRSERFRLYRRE